jgi:hypothetical protein
MTHVTKPMLILTMIYVQAQGLALLLLGSQSAAGLGARTRLPRQRRERRSRTTPRSPSTPARAPMPTEMLRWVTQVRIHGRFSETTMKSCWSDLQKDMLFPTLLNLGLCSQTSSAVSNVQVCPTMVHTATLARLWLRAVAPALVQPLLPTTMTSASKLSSHAPAAQGLV